MNFNSSEYIYSRDAGFTTFPQEDKKEHDGRKRIGVILCKTLESS